MCFPIWMIELRLVVTVQLRKHNAIIIKKKNERKKNTTLYVAEDVLLQCESPV